MEGRLRRTNSFQIFPGRIPKPQASSRMSGCRPHSERPCRHHQSRRPFSAGFVAGACWTLPSGQKRCASGHRPNRLETLLQYIALLHIQRKLPVPSRQCDAVRVHNPKLLPRNSPEAGPYPRLSPPRATTTPMTKESTVDRCKGMRPTPKPSCRLFLLLSLAVFLVLGSLVAMDPFAPSGDIEQDRLVEVALAVLHLQVVLSTVPQILERDLACSAQALDIANSLQGLFQIFGKARSILAYILILRVGW